MARYYNYYKALLGSTYCPQGELLTEKEARKLPPWHRPKLLVPVKAEKSTVYYWFGVRFSTQSSIDFSKLKTWAAHQIIVKYRQQLLPEDRALLEEYLYNIASEKLAEN